MLTDVLTRVAQLHHSVDHNDAIGRLRQRVSVIPNVLSSPAPDIEILKFEAAGPVLVVRPYCNNDNYWQVYFDTNKAIRETFTQADLPSHLHYVGPLRNASPQLISFPYEKLTQQPMIYASLGSVQNTKYSVFHCIAAACEKLDVQLVIAHGGGLNAQAIKSLPGSPLVVKYAPQPDVLAHASLTITHAGMNTTLDSLSYGVPLVAIPITFEQPGTGARISSTGVGEVLSLSKLNTSSLRLAIKRVLSENSYRKNALRIQQSIPMGGGVKQAANIIEQVIAPQFSYVAEAA